MEEFKNKLESQYEISGLQSVRDYKFELDNSHYDKVNNDTVTMSEKSENYDDLIYSKFNNTDMIDEEKENNENNIINTNSNRTGSSNLYYLFRRIRD